MGYLIIGYLITPLDLRFLLRIAILCGIIIWLKQKIKCSFCTRHVLYLGVYLGSIFFSMLFNSVHFSYEQNIAYFRTQFLIPLGGLLAVLLFGINKVFVKKLFWALSLSFIVNNLYALHQAFDGELRVSGLAGHYMGLAGVLLLSVPTLFILLARNNEKDKWKYYLTAMFSSIPVVGFNGTRTVWLVLFIIFCFLIWEFKNKKIAVITVFFVFIVSSILYFHPYYQARVLSISNMQYQSNSERLLIWQSSYQMFKDHPLIGVGVGNFSFVYQSKYILPEAKERFLTHAHNIYLHTLAESGLVGFFGFCLFFSYTLFTSFYIWRKNSNQEALILFVSTISLLLQGLTEVNIGNHTIITRIYWIMLGAYLVSSGMVTYKREA